MSRHQKALKIRDKMKVSHLVFWAVCSGSRDIEHKAHGANTECAAGRKVPGEGCVTALLPVTLCFNMAISGYGLQCLLCRTPALLQVRHHLNCSSKIGHSELAFHSSFTLGHPLPPHFALGKEICLHSGCSNDNCV